MSSPVASIPEPRSVEEPQSEGVSELIRSNAVEVWSAGEILTWAVEKFHPRLSLSASFGAPEGMLLLHMLHAIEPASRVFVLDTGRLPQAVHDLIDRVRDRYDIEVEVVFPRAEDLSGLVRGRGMNSFYESLENRQRCCQVRKVAPLRRHLATLDAYITGLRRDQNVTRAETPKLEIDRGHGDIVKINPIADWSHDQVWQYVRRERVPVNRLHAKGYPSVGCEPCTRPIAAGEDPRSGRWWWENPETRECGLHQTPDTEVEGSGI